MSDSDWSNIKTGWPDLDLTGWSSPDLGAWSAPDLSGWNDTDLSGWSWSALSLDCPELEPIGWPDLGELMSWQSMSKAHQAPLLTAE
jgi:hypothetical protein